jgi:hypothetical protein
MLESGNLNIKWTYQNNTDTKIPFEVPADIIGVDRSKLNTTGVLSDFIAVN